MNKEILLNILAYIIIFTVIGFVVYIVCKDPPTPTKLEKEDSHQRYAKDSANHLKYVMYFKDTKTGLCFAGSHLEHYSAVLTNVPCTPEVEKVAHPFVSDSWE